VAKEGLPLWRFGPTAPKVRNRHEADEKEEESIEDETRNRGRQNAVPAGGPDLRQRVNREH
jgi:hypothetical protein